MTRDMHTKTQMTKSDLRSFFSFSNIFSSICFLNFSFPVSLFFSFSAFLLFLFFCFSLFGFYVVLSLLLRCYASLFCFSASICPCFSVFFLFFWFFCFFTVLLLQCLLGLPFTNANQFEHGQFRYTINQLWINPPPTTKKKVTTGKKLHTLNLSQTDRKPTRINPN